MVGETERPLASRRRILLVPLVLSLACLVVGCATGPSERAAARSTPCIWPVNHPKRTVTSAFGAARGGGAQSRHHNGLDIAAPKGTPVYATADGVVLFAGRDEAYGRIVRIAHGNGIETWYAHLKSRAVKRGKRVELGQRIGKVGHSGRATGPHLHYEVRVNGTPTDPRRYLP